MNQPKSVAIPQRVVDRHWARVDVRGPDECWAWKLSLNPRGYGQVRWQDDGRLRGTGAHRVAWTAINGPIPDGLQIDHLCRNRLCQNPAHLEAVTPRENVLRGDTVTAANAAKTHCNRGHLFDEANTYVRPSGWRKCRACVASRRAAVRARDLGLSGAGSS